MTSSEDLRCQPWLFKQLPIFYRLINHSSIVIHITIMALNLLQAHPHSNKLIQKVETMPVNFNIEFKIELTWTARRRRRLEIKRANPMWRWTGGWVLLWDDFRTHFAAPRTVRTWAIAAITPPTACKIKNNF